MENSNKKNILIAGGSGYIGKSITNFLSEKGFHVSWLTRKKRFSKAPEVDWYEAIGWNHTLRGEVS